MAVKISLNTKPTKYIEIFPSVLSIIVIIIIISSSGISIITDVQLCSCMQVLYSILSHYLLLLFVILQLPDVCFFFNIPFMLVFFFCMCFLFCVFCVYVLFCASFLLQYVADCLLYFYMFTHHCHRVETPVALKKYHISQHLWRILGGSWQSVTGRDSSVGIATRYGLNGPGI